MSKSPVTQSNWKGIDTVKRSVKNIVEASTLQNSKRFILTNLAFMAAQLSPNVLSWHWGNIYPNLTRFNAFMKKNIPLQGKYWDPAKVIVSGGNLEQTSLFEVDYSGDDFLFSWDPSVNSNGSPDDSVMCLVFDLEKRLYFRNHLNVARKFGSYRLPGAQGLNVNSLAAYIYFYRTEAGELLTSKSQYNIVLQVP